MLGEKSIVSVHCIGTASAVLLAASNVAAEIVRTNFEANVLFMIVYSNDSKDFLLVAGWHSGIQQLALVLVLNSR